MSQKLHNMVGYYSLKLELPIMLVQKFGRTSLMIVKVIFGLLVA